MSDNNSNGGGEECTGVGGIIALILSIALNHSLCFTFCVGGST